MAVLCPVLGGSGVKLSIYEEACGTRDPFLLSLLKKDSDCNWNKAFLFKMLAGLQDTAYFQRFMSSSQIGEGLLKK